tara:strand:+ start:153 stop:272 length:120 start_codon:yes stop_codon:yes gene_type:complete
MMLAAWLLLLLEGFVGFCWKQQIRKHVLPKKIGPHIANA